MKDSFGQPVAVGDYVTFVTKTRYVYSQSIGRIVKISPTGRVTINAINTGGKTIPEYRQYTLEHRQASRDNWDKRGVIEHHRADHWLNAAQDEDAATIKPSNTTLHDASSCVRLPSAPTIEIAQVLG